MSRLLALLTCFFLFNTVTNSQSKVSTPRLKTSGGYYNTQADWYNQKTGKHIGIDTILTSIDGKTMDFHLLQHPAFVNFGFYGCHPCEHELPVYIEASIIHPDIDFVYITFDSEETRSREFSELTKPGFTPGKNYYIIHMDRSDINRLDLTLGYPTKYYIDKNGIVQFVTSGGSVSEPPGAILDQIAKTIAGE